MTHWHAAGFGTDPEGDADRRAEQGVVELPDGTRVAGAPDPQAAIAAVARYDRAALPDLGEAITRTAHLVPPSPGEVQVALGVVEGELLPAEDPHALTRTEYAWGIAVVCACGQWECVVTGPSSADWARRDHERHRTLAR